MKRQSIVTTIVEQMKRVSSANGFYTEAGKNVFEWYNKPLEKGEYPAIIVRDTTDDTNDEQTTTMKHRLKIEIDIAVQSKSETIWVMREVISDVLKAFGLVEETLNYVCLYHGSESLTEQQETLYGGVRLEFTVDYHTARWEQ